MLIHVKTVISPNSLVASIVSELFDLQCMAQGPSHGCMYINMHWRINVTANCERSRLWNLAVLRRFTHCYAINGGTVLGAAYDYYTRVIVFEKRGIVVALMCK